MTIKEAINILNGDTIPNKKEDIIKAEKMATRSLEAWNEFESFIDVMFDTETYKYDSAVLTAINDFKSITKSRKRRIENEG